MPRFHWKIDGLSLALVAAMFIASTVTWPRAPERVPIHWDFSGTVDGYGGKLVGLLLLPALTAAIYGLFFVLPYIDPRRANYARFSGAYSLLRATLVVFMASFHTMILLGLWGVDVPIGAVMPILVGLLFVLMGSYMGRLKPTWFVGIRTPWTLTSDLSWDKTHKLGGWVFMASGVIMAVGSLFLGEVGFIGSLLILFGGIAWVMAYSYLVWRRDPRRRDLEGGPAAPKQKGP